MATISQYLPEIMGTELHELEKICGSLNDVQLERFAFTYRNNRRDPILILLCCIIGFFGIAGIHRLITNSILLGVVYIFTAGFCGIGTLIDAINFKNITLEYNLDIAYEIKQNIQRLQ
ncbi:MAG: TM2 domain-containing protein [Bacteroidales bacterium]